jgi:hypothetical protein
MKYRRVSKELYFNPRQGKGRASPRRILGSWAGVAHEADIHVFVSSTFEQSHFPSAPLFS